MEQRVNHRPIDEEVYERHAADLVSVEAAVVGQ